MMPRVRRGLSISEFKRSMKSAQIGFPQQFLAKLEALNLEPSTAVNSPASSV
jgi:hypothetical protein